MSCAPKCMASIMYSTLHPYLPPNSFYLLCQDTGKQEHKYCSSMKINQYNCLPKSAILIPRLEWWDSINGDCTLKVFILYKQTVFDYISLVKTLFDRSHNIIFLWLCHKQISVFSCRRKPFEKENSNNFTS